MCPAARYRDVPRGLTGKCPTASAGTYTHRLSFCAERGRQALPGGIRSQLRDLSVEYAVISFACFLCRRAGKECLLTAWSIVTVGHGASGKYAFGRSSRAFEHQTLHCKPVVVSYLHRGSHLRWTGRGVHCVEITVGHHRTPSGETVPAESYRLKAYDFYAVGRAKILAECECGAFTNRYCTITT